jgi:predicted dienelactone hydrolase
VSVVLVMAILSAACGAMDESTTTSTTSAEIVPVAVDYREPGPYSVGMTMLSTADAPVTVWYPADPATAGDEPDITGYDITDVLPPNVVSVMPSILVPPVETVGHLDVPLASDGPFPVVLYSHGLGGFAENASGQAQHLASWGFVVAAPDHGDRDLLAALFTSPDQASDDVDADVRELRATLGRLAQENARNDGVLRNGLDLDSVGAIGHGEGGRAVARLANDPDVDLWIGQAPLPPLPPLTPLEQLAGVPLAERLADAEPPAKPSLVIAGEGDTIVPLVEVRTLFEWLPSPKRLAVLAGAGHQVFTDLCPPLAGQQGLTRSADTIPAPVGLLARLEDGCVRQGPDLEAALEVVFHLDTAMLRWAFDLDASDASLEPAFVESLFADALAGYEVG